MPLFGSTVQRHSLGEVPWEADATLGAAWKKKPNAYRENIQCDPKNNQKNADAHLRIPPRRLRIAAFVTMHQEMPDHASADQKNARQGSQKRNNPNRT
jgi:hypothetical protein